MAAVDFRVLGPVGVTVDAEPQRLRPMEATVLAVLLADHNHPVTLDVLIDRVWRGRPPRTASTAIRVHIDRLRAAMRRQEVSRLVSTAGGYRLVVEPDELDAQRFDDALRRGRELAGLDPRAAGQQLRDALVQWHGTPFGAIEGIESIDVMRSYLESRRAELLVELAAVELAAGRHAAAVADLRRWCVEFPESEALASSLVLALYRSGDQVAALEECRAFTERFSADYGLDAGRAFRRLENDLLNQHPRLDPPVQAAVTVSSAPIGRQHLVDAVTRLLAAPRPPALIALGGRPGIGVTTVLNHLARALPGAVLLPPDPGAVAGLADAVGVPLTGRSAGDHATAVAGALSRPGRVLIVDDLDTLAPDTLGLLRALARFLGICPFVTGGPTRPLVDHPLLADGSIAATDCVALEVQPLDDTAARALVESLVSGVHPGREALIERVVASAGGDPFLLAALAREAEATGRWVDAPASLEEFVRRSVARLPAGGAELLALAASDRPAYLDLPVLRAALQLSGMESAALAEAALEAGLLIESPHGLAFRHAGFREVLARGPVPTAARRRMIDLLAARPDPDIARIAHQARQLGDTGTEAAHYTAAEAAALLTAGSPLAAADRYAQAVDLAQRAHLGPARWLPWALDATTALTLGGRVEQATTRAGELAAVARRAGAPALFARAALAAAGPWGVPMGADARRAQLLLGEALEWLPADQAALRVRLIESYLRVGMTGDATMLAALGEVEPEIAQRATDPDPAIALDALRALHSLTWPRQQPPRRRLELAQRMAVAGARVDSAGAELEALRLVVGAHVALADRFGASAAVHDYAGRAEATGSVLHRWWATLQAEMLATLAGRRSSAERHARQAQALQAGVDPETVVIASHERMLSDALRDGRLADLAPVLDTLDDEISGFDPLYQIAAAAIAAAVGEPVSVDHLEQLWGDVRGTFRAAAGAGLIVSALGRTEPPTGFADELAGELAVYGGGWLVIGGSAGIGPADFHLARLLRLRGRLDESIRHARLATSVAHKFAPTWVRFTQKETPDA
ncbi:MAG: BTAD domain-containing putative transcriptional regulator [Micropruina sp.]|uniref:BTAD domain-containing putative transcriptional regulator n=1 Tax=Micropruina sp. TaxID=2737536 RepID=UPI0039E353DC